MRNCAELQQALTEDLGKLDHFCCSDMDLATVRSIQLKSAFLKKFEDNVGPLAESAALELFNRSNRRCGDFRWEPDGIYDDVLLGEVKSLWVDVVGNGPESAIPLSAILDNVGVGPGANQGGRSDNFYTKVFDSPLTGTSDLLYRYYRYAIASSPTLISAEKARLRRHGVRMVVGNRLSFAPKTSDISRTICTEPTLNMFLQKGIGFVLEQRLKDMFKIQLSRQPELNRRLARIGSVDGSYGTIDLSSASDSMSLKMLELVVPEELLGYLRAARSPFVTFPSGEVNELLMVSSMGNGFTFPLESLLFAIIVVASYRVLGIIPEYSREGPRNWGVFGDDIVVRKDAYAFVVRALNLFGFTVNDQKSFNSGHFRESCGGDYWQGHDVRGVYVKSLKTSSDVYSVINRLMRWMGRTWVLLPRTSKLLLGWAKFLPIPYSDGDAEGVKIPYPPSDLRVVPSLNAVEYRALVKVARKVKMPLSDDVRSFLTHYGERREIFYNPSGLLAAFTRGVIRSGSVGLRGDPTTDRFKIRKRVTSSWSFWAAGAPLRNHLEYLSYVQYSACSYRGPLTVSPKDPDSCWETVVDLLILNR